MLNGSYLSGGSEGAPGSKYRPIGALMEPPSPLVFYDGPRALSMLLAAKERQKKIVLRRRKGGWYSSYLEGEVSLGPVVQGLVRFRGPSLSGEAISS